MAKRVRGTLFLDYVRMIRKRKSVDWNKYLEPGDFEIMEQMILPSQWYPLDTFQRMGVAVLQEIAGGDVQVVREWGRSSLDELTKVYKSLVDPSGPVRSLERLKIMRNRFFDFEGLELEQLESNRVRVHVDMAFEKVADEAYAYQMLGTFERLLELSGAKNIKHEFIQKGWEQDPHTVMDLSWE